MKANEPDALSKTTRVNLLFDFYEPLLTEKQQTFLKYYFHDDFSLGEIAAEFGISRQAVYDNVKRAEQALEGYESKLNLLAKHETLLKLTEQLEKSVMSLVIDDTARAALVNVIDAFRAADNRLEKEVTVHGSI
ncbi:putative DNA-binding protein [Paenibacillus sp. YIM B09110]|uniref:putative DNA-binding protein n=1 Tax=unclassified Paenibacillus TaxID=185978 RepID=UPI00301D051B